MSDLAEYGTDTSHDYMDSAVVQPELPFKRLVRHTDPDTSLQAAIKATKASRRCVTAVRQVMETGFVGIDEQIWQACRRNGYVSSLDTVEHGRLALCEAGLVVDTGERRETSNGALSRVWRWA